MIAYWILLLNIQNLEGTPIINEDEDEGEGGGEEGEGEEGVAEVVEGINNTIIIL